MSEASSSFNLRFCYSDVLEELRPLDERFVLGCINQHGSAAAVLCEDDWPLSTLNLAHDRGKVGPEICQGPDVFRGANARHAGSWLVYVIMYTSHLAGASPHGHSGSLRPNDLALTCVRAGRRVAGHSRPEKCPASTTGSTPC